MQIIINVSKTHARVFGTLLLILAVGISADYASGAGGLTKWHPLSEISADNGATSIANTISVPSQGNVTIAGNLSITGNGNGIRFPDSSVLKTASGVGGGGGWATSGINVYNNTPGVNVGIGTANPGGTIGFLSPTSSIFWPTSPGYADSRAWQIIGEQGVYGIMQIRSSTDNSNAIARNVMTFDKSGNVGVGTASPGVKLDVLGRISASTGFAVATKDDAGDMASGSGFFQTVAPVNYYAGASSWQHLIESRHSNDANNYALQIAGSFFDQDLYFRKTNNNPSTAWNKFIYQNSAGNVGIGTTAPGAKLDVQGGQIRFKGINLEYVTGSNPTCPAGTGGIVIRKWSQPSCTVYCSCNLFMGWSMETPSCQASTTMNWGQCNPNALGTCYSSTWSEAICMGN